MRPLGLRSFHQQLHARIGELNGEEIVLDYGDVLAEHLALSQTAGLLDLSFRGRICVVGTDRVRFLHGQVTNDVDALSAGRGCYAALITAKGRMVSDANIYRLDDELLLDFEPGLTAKVTERLEQYVIADDVQAIDVSADYGLLSVQGPRARELAAGLAEWPPEALGVVRVKDTDAGEAYLVNQPRLGTAGFDLFVPVAAMESYAHRLGAAISAFGGRWCGWHAFETVRVEAGIPRFGADMDESNLPPEAGLDARAISYSKGCYIGQEIIARIRTYGQVARTLCALRLSDALGELPLRGDVLSYEGKEVGQITSAARSPADGRNLALGYVRREANAPGTELTLRTAAGESLARIIGRTALEKFA